MGFGAIGLGVLEFRLLGPGFVFSIVGLRHVRLRLSIRGYGCQFGSWVRHDMSNEESGFNVARSSA